MRLRQTACSMGRPVGTAPHTTTQRKPLAKSNARRPGVSEEMVRFHLRRTKINPPDVRFRLQLPLVIKQPTTASEYNRQRTTSHPRLCRESYAVAELRT